MRRPTLMELAHLGEALAGIGVIVSMVFLALQVRENTELLRAQQHYLTTQLDFENTKLATNEELARISEKAISGLGGLSPTEQRRYLAHQAQIFVTWEYVYYQNSRGALEDEIWMAWVASISDHLAQSTGRREAWASRRHWYGKRFREFIDRDVLGRSGLEEE